MTPIKTIKNDLKSLFETARGCSRLTWIPIVLYIILNDHDENGYINALIVSGTWFVIHVISLMILQHDMEKMLHTYNEERQAENHELAKLLVDGKLYQNPQIEDTVLEMAKIHFENKTNESHGG